MKKRILFLVAVAAVAATASVSAAQARVVTNETTSLSYSGFVPCANGGAGELMTGSIEVHSLVTSTVNGAVDVWQFDFQPHGTLVGRITGDSYQLTGVTRGIYVDALHSGEYAATYVNNYRLIGPGPGNNLVVREIAHVTRDGDDVVVQHDNLTIDCG